jgi:hypothetical protein
MRERAKKVERTWQLERAIAFEGTKYGERATSDERTIMQERAVADEGTKWIER